MIEKRQTLSTSSDDSEHSSGESNYRPANDAHDSASNRLRRLRANDRERKRVHMINCAMDSLRSVVPGLRDKRKLTKLELLRAANQYIWLLNESLRTNRSIDEIQREIQRVQESHRFIYVGFPIPVLKQEQPGFPVPALKQEQPGFPIPVLKQEQPEH